MVRTLDTVDAANTWEYLHARATVNNNVITYISLPDYGDYRQLAERSWGHMLAASGVLCLAGYDLTSGRQRA